MSENKLPRLRIVYVIIFSALTLQAAPFVPKKSKHVYTVPIPRGALNKAARQAKQLWENVSKKHGYLVKSQLRCQDKVQGYEGSHEDEEYKSLISIQQIYGACDEFFQYWATAKDLLNQNRWNGLPVHPSREKDMIEASSEALMHYYSVGTFVLDQMESADSLVRQNWGSQELTRHVSSFQSIQTEFKSKFQTLVQKIEKIRLLSMNRNPINFTI